jgi:hypothetical protein
LITRLIERSPIMGGGGLSRAASRRAAPLDLPSGYEAVDLFILGWLASEARRRNYLPQ